MRALPAAILALITMSNASAQEGGKVFAAGSLREALTVAARVIEVPPSLAVEAVYGVALMHGANVGGQAFRDFLLSPAGQAILAAQGFSGID